MNFISILIYLLVGLAAGIGLIGMSLEINYLDISGYISTLSAMVTNSPLTRTIIFLCGCLIILIFLRFLQKGLTRCRREKTIKTETENGYISVTLTAIEDMIRKSLSDEDIISYIKPKILATRKEIISYVRLALKEAVNIKDFAESMQIKLKEKLQALLGNEKMLKINIEVKKIAFPRKYAEENEKEDDEEGPLRKY
ncbi:MAG: hypothetical protein B1H08_03940 [Candidatus Omnitrophica bacterium 4484_171]|nr:MAG: hypothetical protein B1H08_03940 [Candidatus Omnitrophica bacterium 4484_171]